MAAKKTTSSKKTTTSKKSSAKPKKSRGIMNQNQRKQLDALERMAKRGS